ncbi:MAG: hypothetical protein WA091_00155 [Minisyncoccales bacterium]
MDKRLNCLKYFIFFITIILVVFLIFEENKESEKPNDEKVNQVISYVKKEIDQSDWREYINERLGFSIKIPKEISLLNRCSADAGDFVAVKVFEDKENNSVYIIPEYYYDWKEDSQKCEKIEYSLALIKEEGGRKPFLGWKIDVVEINNSEELTKFIKSNFGEACIVGDKKDEGGGIYNVKIIGEDWTNQRTESTCPWEMHYKIIYLPEKHKLLSVRLGIDYDFFVYDSEVQGGLIDYGQEMLKSLKIQ